jgi:BMFP domain-containing protein YqiC
MRQLLRIRMASQALLWVTPKVGLEFGANRAIMAIIETENIVQPENKIFDDVSKLATSALGVAQNVKEELETLVRQRLERAVADLDVVSREEFDTVWEMAQKAREENAELRTRIDALEAQLAKGS